MVKALHREEIVYQAVRAGELSIDPEGRIWRHGVRRWDRWTKAVVYRQLATPTRAENPTGKGYLQVRVMIGGVRYHALAHRLVWFHANGPIPEGLTINHKNGVKGENYPGNLELATSAEQTRHAREVLGRVRDQAGSRNSMAKLTPEQVSSIKARRSAGEKLTNIARDFGVTMQTVSKIARGDRRSLG